MMDVAVVVGTAAVIAFGMIIGWFVNEMVHKRREKKELEEWKEFLRKKKEERDVERSKRDYLEMLEKHGGSYPKWQDLGKVLADDVLERQGLKEREPKSPKWPEGPHIIDEADVRPIKKPGIIRRRLSRRVFK